jgi:hypothetical protein
MLKTEPVKTLRKQLFVDPRVQGALVLRVMLYWLECMLSIVLMFLCWRIMTDPGRLLQDQLGDIWFDYGPACLASVALLPLVVLDIMRLSNRFCGPLLRLRRSLRELARGECVEPLEFRGSDYWPNLAQEFNAVAARVQEQSGVTPPAKDAPQSLTPAEMC